VVERAAVTEVTREEGGSATTRASAASALELRPKARPELARVEYVLHGAVGAVELGARGLERERMIDFSASTNPLGPPPGVLEALRSLSSEMVARYPDPTAAGLRRELAARLGVDAEQVICGNGSSEIIWLLALAYARPAPERVLIVGPTFGEYARACRLMGADVEWHVADAAGGFAVDVESLARQIGATRPRLLCLCNPNNPTGIYLRRAAIERVAAACMGAGSMLVVDEAYLSFVDNPESLIGMLEAGHVFLLRSMTKNFGLAGIRLGYGVGARDVVAELRKAQAPWSVSAVAQAAGEAALEDEGYMERSRRAVWAARRRLVDGMSALGFGVHEPTANFVLAGIPDGWESAAQLREALFAQGCVVRDCASFGLPGYIRVGVRARAECERLVAAMATVIEERAQ